MFQKEKKRKPFKQHIKAAMLIREVRGVTTLIELLCELTKLLCLLQLNKLPAVQMAGKEDSHFDGDVCEQAAADLKTKLHCKRNNY